MAIAISLFNLLRWAAEGLLHIGHVVGKTARIVVLNSNERHFLLIISIPHYGSSRLAALLILL